MLRSGTCSQRLALATVIALAIVGAGPAVAGCGCDHPAPAWSAVMPPFGWAGQPVTLDARGARFVVGARYEVEFGDKKQRVIATHASHLTVPVPHGLRPGPTEIEVEGDGLELEYDEALFTALPKPFEVKPYSAELLAKRVKVAVDADGVVLVPVDLSRVHDPMQFALQFEGLSLDFGEDDVVLYNAQGVDLTVFTLHVEDATQRQWGSYYGWSVEEEAGLSGVRYAPKVEKARRKSERSDVFFYWRHEFHSYAKAHAPGGTHEVGANGAHPDGSLHIDHDHLVIAIHGLDFPLAERAKLVEADAQLERDLARAADAGDVARATEKHANSVARIRARAERLKGGDQRVDVRLRAIRAERPMEPDAVVAEPLRVELIEAERRGESDDD